MPTFSSEPEPVKTEWHVEEYVAGEKKERLGNKSMFNYHCGRRMRRVISFQKTDKGIHRIGCNSWICQACGVRKFREIDIM